MIENENCTHECGSCGEECTSRTQPFDFRAKPNPLSSVGKVIGVVSRKGRSRKVSGYFASSRTDAENGSSVSYSGR